MATSLNTSVPVKDQMPNMEQSRLRTLTASATLSDIHDGQTILLDAAAGLTVTLPAAVGSGKKFKFIVKTTVTSNNDVIQVTGDDTMTGMILTLQDAADTVVGWETAATSDTITLNGTTTGGIKGDVIELEDVATDLWHVTGMTSATGTEATPFSAAVS